MLLSGGDGKPSRGSRSWGATHANQTLIERFNGSAWSVVPSPNQGTGNNALNGVSMIPGAGWAVGYAQAEKYQPLALGWDGTQWSLASTGTFPSDALFTGVDTLADGSAWAVGFQRTATGTRQTLIEQESGGVWAPVASPDDGTATTDNSLTAIAGTQATGLWAVGWRESPGGLQPLILRYDTTQPSPTWVSVTGAGDDPAMGLDLNIGSLCAHTVDYNSDGWPDLLVCGETGGLHLFENDQGQGFTHVSSILGAPVNAVDAAMVDVNHDNRPDLITLTGTTDTNGLYPSGATR